MRPLHSTKVEEGLEGPDFMVFWGSRALRQATARLSLIDRHHLFLWRFSPIGRLASAAERFASTRQMDMALACLCH